MEMDLESLVLDLQKANFDKNLTVAVWMVTYNHERFIGQAIESVLKQQTNFKFKLFIGEDKSTDGTDKICKRYADNYPEVIVLNSNKHNLGPTINAMQIYEMCANSGAQFIAMLEGDDYWCDPLKLQKQYNAIIANENISLVSCKVNQVENDKIVGKGAGGTRTYFFRNSEEFSNMANFNRFIFFGDVLLKSILELQGKELVLEDTMAVWRRHQGGIWGSLSESIENKRTLEFQRSSSFFWIGVYHFDQGRNYLATRYIVKAMMKLMIAIPELEMRVGINFYKKSLKKMIFKLYRQIV